MQNLTHLACEHDIFQFIFFKCYCRSFCQSWIWFQPLLKMLHCGICLLLTTYILDLGGCSSTLSDSDYKSWVSGFPSFGIYHGWYIKVRLKVSFILTWVYKGWSQICLMVGDNLSLKKKKKLEKIKESIRQIFLKRIAWKIAIWIGIIFQLKCSPSLSLVNLQSNDNLEYLLSFPTPVFTYCFKKWVSHLIE